MAARAALAAKRTGAVARGTSGDMGPLDRLLAIPMWVRLAVGALVLLALLGGGGYWLYTALDPLYPQELWKYFRPAPPLAGGSLLYRDLDGQLFIAPASDPKAGRRLLDAEAAAGSHEIVRDAAALPDKRHVAYYASEKREGQAEQDVLKVVTLDGALVRRVPVLSTGEAIRPSIFTSTSGRYVALTNRERSLVYYLDVAGEGGLVAGTLDAAPERMLWNRNADLRTAHSPGQQPYAASPDGKLRAQLRAGRRRAPECEEARCEAGQELIVGSGTVASSGQQPAVLYGAFTSFSADGWGPIPAQPAQRLYGRLVWAPDGSQLIFSTLDGDTSNSYAIGTDGRTAPRLLLESAEALDWLP